MYIYQHIFEKNLKQLNYFQCSTLRQFAKLLSEIYCCYSF